MKKIVILIIVFFSYYAAAAQGLVSIQLENATVNELFEVIEQQAGCRIYSDPEDIEDIRVTLSRENETPLKVLERAFEGTNLKITPYNNILFVAQSRRLVASLPLIFKKKEDKGAEEDSIFVAYDVSRFLLQDDDKKQKLISETKVYEIGNARKKRSGMVTLSGNITNYRSEEPMAGLSLHLNNSTSVVTSDANGFYSIRIPTGRQELNVKGYNLKDTKIQLMVYENGVLNFGVEEVMQALTEATISAERIANVRSTTMGLERVKMQDIKNIPTLFGEVDVIKVVLSLPGVKSVGEMSSGFNVRGGATDQNLILFNDGTIYNPSHLFGVFSAFNPDVINSMELYKSSIPAKYGGRISSVLDISEKEGNKDKVGGSASVGLLTSRVTLDGPIVKGKTSFIVGGRTTYSDWMLKRLPEKSGYKDGSAEFFDLNAGVSHKFDERNSLQVNGYYSYDRFSFTDKQKYSYRNTNVSAKWRRIFSEELMGSFTGGYDHYDYSTKDTEIAYRAYSLDFAINQGFGKLDFLWKAADKHTLDFGLSSIYYSLNPGEYLPYGDESVARADKTQREKALESALYINDTWDISDKLSVSLGIRYSIFNVIGSRTYNTYNPDYLPSLLTITDTKTGSGIFKTYHGPELRGSIRYAFTDDFSVKAGVNTMRQNIHKISNTTVMSPTDTWKLSDANIKPQTGMQVAAGLYKNFFDNLVETSVEGYYKTMDNFLDYKSGAELTMNHHLETDVLPMTGRAYGVELMVKKTRGKLSGWISYTYSKTELKQDDDRAADPINRGVWYPADFDRPRDFKFVGNYKLTHRFSVSVNCDYTTGRPITLPISKYIYQNGQYVYYSDRNAYRVRDYFRMDVSFNIEPGHRLTKLTHSSLSFGVYNVTGRKNPYSVYYVTENGNLKGYQLAIFGVPIPYVAYNLKF
ncbi:MAG: TonB-dependent receptor [Prevotellaceae bacterium]|jgi:hypothetical protein|nr:TonB-dependent receptor [Prevotellaceae bacterium]